MALYRGMEKAALDAAYNNTEAVADSARIVAGWQARSEAFRRSHSRSLDRKYGERPRNLIDIFEAGENSPLLAFIHGGYWQNRSKELFSFLAAGPLAHGISVAMLGYTLAPEVRLDEIVGEIRLALDFLQKKHSRLTVSGWSAGGHLAAMAMSHPAVQAGIAISGIYDLEPMRLSYINDKLRLDEAESRRNSPMLLPSSGKPLVLAYGTSELPELQRQSRDYAQACKGATLLPMEGDNHFSILDALASPAGELTRQAIGACKPSRPARP